MKKIEIKLPASQKYVSLARLTIASVATNMGFSIGDVEDLEVAISEACTNAICHSTAPEATFDLTYIVGEKELTFTVSDTGVGFEPDLVKLPGENEDALINGFGLFVIEILMDSVEIVSEKGVGTSITMVKNLPSKMVTLMPLSHQALSTKIQNTVEMSSSELHAKII